MAIIPSSKYTGQVDTSDPTGYPQGKAQNVTTAGDGTGTPLEQDWVNDIWGFLQRLLSDGGITPDGNPDTVSDSEYKDALDAIYQRISVPDDGDDYTLVWWSNRGTYELRLYVSDGSITLARNASWLQGTGWVSEGSLNSTINISANSTGGSMTTQWGTITTGSFANSYTTSIGGSLGAGCSAAGRIKTGSSDQVIYARGKSVSSLTYNGSTLQINFADPLGPSTSEIIPLATPMLDAAVANSIHLHTKVTTTSQIEITAYDASGVQENLSSLAFYIGYMISSNAS